MQGATTGTVRIVLRLEGLLAFTAASAAYSRLGFDWATFAWWFLLPDLSLLAYLIGERFGAGAYNVAHSYVGAVACLMAGWWWAAPAWSGAGLIWCAHIGLDRALGFGLKYATGFGDTHLGRIGRVAATS